DLERAVEIIGLNLEAASQIGILARHVGSATGYAWQAIRLAETASQYHYGEPAAGGKIARLRQHHVGAQGLVLLGFGILAVRDQRDRRTPVHLRGLYDQRFQPEAPLVVLNRQKRTLLQQFVVQARSGRSHRRRRARGFDLGHRDLDRCRGLRRSTGGRDAGDRPVALGERGGGLAFGRGKRVGRRPLER